MNRKFEGKFKKDGLDFMKGRDAILRYASFHVGQRFALIPLEPESEVQRGFYEGGVIPLWIYLDGYDFRDPVKQKQYHQHANEEFNPEVLTINGKNVKKGASSKGKLNGENGIINKVIDMLEEQYGIDRIECLDPAKYKDWRDRIKINGEYDEYIDYLVAMGKLKRVELSTTR